MADASVALVTGASSGIGRSIAQRLGAAGYRVFGTSRRGAEPGGHEAPPGASAPGLVEMLSLDVREDASVDACVENALQRAGRIDLLVNNAGLYLRGAVEETTLDEARALYETNFFGTVRVTNAVLPHMRARAHGHIINIGSLSAYFPLPFGAFYSSAKAALLNYTEALRHEVASLGVRVSVIVPGFVRTDISAHSERAEREIPAYAAMRRAAVGTMTRSVERGITPDDVAAVVVRAARSAAPRLVYRVGRDAAWLPRVRAILPAALVERETRRTFHLDTPPRDD
ncbi:MAG TPA: SDR family NAD(P)-dependent oxidoreductase [Gemmatimonadaceae bacterium]|nr:SDR family NAD(P)-dependent oxidoreductase [Gemmatimonadaceae bacterium]